MSSQLASYRVSNAKVGRAPNHLRFALLVFILPLLMASCSDAGFLDQQSAKSLKADESKESKERESDDAQIFPEEVGKDKSTSKTDSTSQSSLDIDGASETEKATLEKCLAKFPDNPFQGKIKNFKRIKSIQSIGGMGTAISDSVKTAEPFLVLVKSVNSIGSSLEFKLLNPNGYYCIESSNSIGSNIDVELSCSARLADENQTVSAIGSSSNGAIANSSNQIGSNTTITDNRDDESEYPCIR